MGEGRQRRPLKLFPCHYDGLFSAAIAAAIELAAAMRIAAAARGGKAATAAIGFPLRYAAVIRIAAAAPVSTTVFPCFPLQGLSCG